MSHHNEMVERMTAKYKTLISRFLDRQMSAEEFQTSYFTMFKNDQDQVPSIEFKVLDKLFADADDYTADSGLRRRAGGLNDEELRIRAGEAYGKLYKSFS